MKEEEDKKNSYFWLEKKNSSEKKKTKNFFFSFFDQFFEFLSFDMNSNPNPNPTRSFPSHPRVGVSTIIFKTFPRPLKPKILLVRRAKEPKIGHWSFPGGGEIELIWIKKSIQNKKTRMATLVLR